MSPGTLCLHLHPHLPHASPMELLYSCLTLTQTNAKFRVYDFGFGTLGRGKRKEDEGEKTGRGGEEEGAEGREDVKEEPNLFKIHFADLLNAWDQVKS